MFKRLRQTIPPVTYGGFIMAVGRSAGSKRSKHQFTGEYPDELGEQDYEDVEASRKIAEEEGLPRKKSHLAE
jgi:hypothetical protein